MKEIIDWCNTNNGFLTGILSIIGVLISTIAIVVSIRTALLPYKKRIKLWSNTLYEVVPGIGLQNSPENVLFEASATNVGNRTVFLTFLGYATKVKGKFKRFYITNRDFDCKAKLQPAECKGTKYTAKELIAGYANFDKTTKMYVYASDSEGKEYVRRIGTVGKMIAGFQ